MSIEILNLAETASLSCQEGSADKVYQASLRAVDDLWVVEFAYGKRSSSLKTGTKTQEPVDYKTAKSVFDKLIKSKLSGGYVSDVGATAYTRAEGGAEDSGMRPQLPIALEEADVAKLMRDESWWLQRKYDGENRMIQVRSGQVRGINRKGYFVDLPQDWKDYLSVLPDCLIAGEHCGSLFHAFDLLERDGSDLRGLNFQARFSALQRLIGVTFKWFEGTEEEGQACRDETAVRFRIVEAHSRGELKQKAFEKLKLDGCEGVVFKSVYDTFETGKSLASRKFKFVESCTCIVLSLNTQRSVQIGCLDLDGSMVNLGSVTIPANHEVPAVDDLAEVRYLYRFENGCLEQPCYLGVRNDIDRSDAGIWQISRIKAKATSVA